MLTYTKLSGDVLDLSHLTDEERAYFDRCYAAYRDGLAWVDFGNRLLYGPENPLLRTTNGMVTQEVYGQQRMMAPALGDDLARDPLADEWIPVKDAGARKGVSHNALHYAIRQGNVGATAAKAGGSALLVSARSLERWQPSPARQQAARARRKSPAA